MGFFDAFTDFAGKASGFVGSALQTGTGIFEDLAKLKSAVDSLRGASSGEVYGPPYPPPTPLQGTGALEGQSGGVFASSGTNTVLIVAAVGVVLYLVARRG